MAHELNLTDPRPSNFFLVLCKTRKKFDKYVKINRIRNKYVVDIKKMMEEEGIDKENLNSSKLFKVLVLKKFNLAIDKKKDIYYIPNFDVTKEYGKLFNIKEMLKDSHNFNLLYFKADFGPEENVDDIIDRIAEFNVSQVLKDY